MNLLARGRLRDLKPEIVDRLLARSVDAEAFVDAVRPFRDAVRERGDEALRDLTERFDGHRPDALEVPRDAWDAAADSLAPSVLDALEAAHANVRRFHEAQAQRQAEDVDVVPGLRAGRRVRPVARAGCYVPGGRAAYPSTVLMTATPARVAGVGEVVVCTPPDAEGRVPAATLAACRVAGVDRVFRVGGAQAVFALAYGTETVPRCQRIVGPGNAYVAAAKGLVAGSVGTDAPAGPSEVLVVADETADPEFVAWDLLAQAEHDPLAASVLVTPSAALADDVDACLDRLLGRTVRAGIVREALAARGGLLVTDTLEEALAFADRYAPEHLHLQVRDPDAALARVENYGSAFLGDWSPVALGDYCSGPNHVLPTGGLAAAHSGLSVDDFVRKPTHQRATPDALRTLGPVAATLADYEGLQAHAASVRTRLERLEKRGGE